MRQVPVVDDPVEWEARHPGMTAPTEMVNEVDFAPTKAQFTGKPWHQCVLCGWIANEGEMNRVGGKWYCVVNGCAVEASL